MIDLSTVTAEQFAKFQDQEFEVASPEGAVTLKLVEVSKLGSGERQGGAFSLLWQGPMAPALAQQTHLVSHPEVGAHEVFFVPVAQTDAGLQYEAVFT
jgi:hypothetical protein